MSTHSPQNLNERNDHVGETDKRFMEQKTRKLDETPKTPAAKKQEDSEAKFRAGCLLAIVALSVAAFYGWYSGGWERGYERQRQRDREMLKRLERAYQMSPDEYQRALDEVNREAPVGQTRGGDPY